MCLCFCIGMIYIQGVGGSVFESLILEWNSSFDISHLPTPEAPGNRKKKERKRIQPPSGDACFHGDVEHVLVCMVTSHIHILLTSLFFCQDADSVPASTRHMVQSHVRLQFIGGIICSKCEKSTGDGHQLEVTILVTFTLTTFSLGFILSMVTVLSWISWNFRSFSSNIENREFFSWVLLSEEA